jgi:hypothetical protein
MLTVDGTKVGLSFQGFPPLEPGERFLFFVKYHKDLDIFQAAISHGIFQVVFPLLTNPKSRSELPGRGPTIDELLTILKGVECR